MSEHNPIPAGSVFALKRMRWWIPVSIIALAIGNLIRLRFSSELDSNFKAMQTSLTFGLLLLLIILWFAFFSRLRWRIRLAGLLLFALLGFGVTRLVRFDGAVDGTGTPNIVWNWKPKKTGNAGPLNIVANAAPSNSVATAAQDSGYLGPNRNGVVEGIKLNQN